MPLIFCLGLLFSLNLMAHVVSDKPVTVITSLDSAKAVGGVILSKDDSSNTAVTYLNQLQLSQLSSLNHLQGKCAGFETLSDDEVMQPGLLLQNLKVTDTKFKSLGLIRPTVLTWNEEYQKLADKADPVQLKETISWISSYPTRYNKAPSPNQHVDELKTKLESWLRDARWPYQIEIINHKSTKQNTLRLTITGKTKPTEVIVLGGHLDSINTGYSNTDKAPGADDNASGSANLIEAVKILKNANQPNRTLEFYWYAGEESGLLGSAEIAKEAKAKNKNVIAVMQLDMTLFPGSGEQVIGLVTDFTSPWLRELLTAMNNTYTKARFVPDECGYACSDHASWHRQGYHAVTPFEAITQTMNGNIHSAKDVIDSKSSFQHSNTFTQLAIVFALVLGNSDIKPPSIN
ncbi:MAG: M20/M25/M40 family metallo-hydrolase [Bdellovibrio sp.]|nr:M20/M25/M40 family metallo-hydrolase [Bdellovibrio sp.]